MGFRKLVEWGGDGDFNTPPDLALSYICMFPMRFNQTDGSSTTAVLGV